MNDFVIKRARLGAVGRGVLALILGQVISVFVALTGITSTALSASYHLSAPTSQSILLYFLLSVVYIPAFIAYRHYHKGVEGTSTPTPKSTWARIKYFTFLDVPGENYLQIIRRRGWFYAILAMLDVEANWIVVGAYHYTSLTSVMLLDCFTIPCVVVLSTLFLQRKYHLLRLLGILICILGVLMMVSADFLGISAASPPGPHPLLGDAMVLIGAFLYACSNVGQEGIVQSLHPLEYLACMSPFACILSVVQALLLESHLLLHAHWRPDMLLIFTTFSLCQFAIYSLVPLLLSISSSVVLNLSLLTSDALAALAAALLFHATPLPTYYGALALVALGILLYHAKDFLSPLVQL